MPWHVTDMRDSDARQSFPEDLRRFAVVSTCDIFVRSSISVIVLTCKDPNGHHPRKHQGKLLHGNTRAFEIRTSYVHVRASMQCAIKYFTLDVLTQKQT